MKNTFEYATSKGINWFDTADSYGTGALNGRSEELLGQFLSKNKKSSTAITIRVCTKIAPFPWRIGKSSMFNSIAASKERIKRPIDTLQLHWPPTLRWQQPAYLDAFSDAVRCGDALQIGMSNFGPERLTEVVKQLEQRGLKAYTNQVQNIQPLVAEEYTVQINRSVIVLIFRSSFLC